MTMKILNKILGRKESLREVSKELPEEQKAFLAEAPKKLPNPTTLSQVVERYGKVISSADEYMDQDYVEVSFYANPTRPYGGISYSFVSPNYSFKIKKGLEGVADGSSLVDILGRNSKNNCSKRCENGTLCEGSGGRTRIIIPEEALDNLDDEYLKKLESVSGEAETCQYSTSDFNFGINLRYLSSKSSKVPKIARRDARVGDTRIEQLKTKPMENKYELIETYRKHPFMDKSKKEKLIGMLKRIPDKVDTSKIIEDRENNYYSYYQASEAQIVQEVTSDLTKLKKLLSEKVSRFERQYGRVDETSDETTAKMYTERLNDLLREDRDKIKRIAFKRMKILDTFCNPDEYTTLREKVKSNGIRSLNRGEWKKYYTSLRALNKINLNDDSEEVASAW